MSEFFHHFPAGSVNDDPSNSPRLAREREMERAKQWHRKFLEISQESPQYADKFIHVLKVVNRCDGYFLEEITHSMEAYLGLSRASLSLVPFVDVETPLCKDVAFEGEMFPDSWGVKCLVPATADL